MSFTRIRVSGCARSVSPVRPSQLSKLLTSTRLFNKPVSPDPIDPRLLFHLRATKPLLFSHCSVAIHLLVSTHAPFHFHISIPEGIVSPFPTLNKLPDRTTSSGPSSSTRRPAYPDPRRALHRTPFVPVRVPAGKDQRSARASPLRVRSTTRSTIRRPATTGSSCCARKMADMHVERRRYHGGGGGGDRNHGGGGRYGGRGRKRGFRDRGTCWVVMELRRCPMSGTGWMGLLPSTPPR